MTFRLLPLTLRAASVHHSHPSLLRPFSPTYYAIPHPPSLRFLSTSPSPPPLPVPDPPALPPLPTDPDTSLSALIVSTSADTLQSFLSTATLDYTLYPVAPALLLSAIALRSLTLPLLYHHQLHQGRAALAARELPRIHAFVRHTPGTLLQKYVTYRRLRRLALRAAGTREWRLWRWHLFAHVPLVVSASMGVRELVSRGGVEWKEGGVGWFTDLTMADPAGVLPLLTTALWVWNLDPRTGTKATEGSAAAQVTLPRESRKADAADAGETESGEKRRNATMGRVMRSGAGTWLAPVLQTVCVASLAVTRDAPSGLLVLWIGNGVVTAMQRTLLSSEGVRRGLGLVTAEEMSGGGEGPRVLEGVRMGVEKVRRELEYVQREVLTRFPNGAVDEEARRGVQKVLERERRRGRISMQLEAVIREDERDGKKYIAVVRKGAGR